MARITVELIRKRSEHNEGEISTLEEISLHQENIERIEFLGKACRNLKILLLQNNLISKIENLNMLKRLEYLNLALNNIEAIENLEGLESLQKLDLTINFIGNLEDVKSLRCNEHLEELFLTGNPCADYEGYREYVITMLPQLKQLDGQEILRSERIRALQGYAEAEGDVIRACRKYRTFREKQIDRHQSERLTITEINEGEPDDDDDDDDEAENERFWKSKSYHTPEDRLAIAARAIKNERAKNRGPKETEAKAKYVPKLFSPDGRPYNVNQPKVPFHLNDDDDPENVILDVGIYRYLDTSHVDVDVQPTYVRVTIKGKILQLSLPCEVSVDRSTAKRSATTGSLLVSMPRLNPREILRRAEPRNGDPKKKRATVSVRAQPPRPKRELLEIGPVRDFPDFANIVGDSRETSRREETRRDETKSSGNDQDDLDVPPLERVHF